LLQSLQLKKNNMFFKLQNYYNHIVLFEERAGTFDIIDFSRNI